jgi:superfamily I DNA/RNA helicase
MAIAAPPGMITSIDRIWLLRPFLRVLEKRSAEIRLRAQLDECVKALWQDPRGHGLNLEQLRVCGSYPVLSARITQQFRLVLAQLGAREVGLLYFDGHDEAYRWVDHNSAHIPRMLERVEELRRGDGPVSRPAAFPRADESDPIALADSREFSAMVEAGVERYLTYLDDDQRRLVKMTVATTLLVKGGAGTGKTAVAVHRLKDVLQQPELDRRPVLYLCYNRVLGECVGQLLDAMFGGKHPEELEVATFHHWCRTYLARAGLRVAVAENGASEVGSIPRPAPEGPPDLTVDQSGVEQLFYRLVFARLSAEDKEALREVGPPNAWREITYVVKGNGLASLEEYLAFNRQGWKLRLKRDARVAIWKCHERLAQVLAEKRIVQWEDLPILVRDRLPSDPDQPPYRAVVVDEAQDFGPVMLDVARRLAGSQSGRLTIFADPGQDIYNRTSCLPPGRSPLGGATRWLRRNYRNTAEIFALARGLLVACPDLRDDLAHADAPLRHGLKPTLVVAASVAEEVEEVCGRLAADLATSRPGRVAILCPTHEGLLAFRRGLEAREIPFCLPSREMPLALAEASVKLLTVASAKGLDFPVVYLVRVSSQVFGGPARAGEVATKKSLYVALTRASEKLVVSTTLGKHHPLLETLDAANYEAAGTRGQAFLNLRGLGPPAGS